MNVQREIMDWFTEKTDEQFQNFKDVQRGSAICSYLCDLSDKSDMKNQIQSGSTYEERHSNYELAKLLIEEIGLEFTYDIDKLSRLDKTEFIRFAQEIMSLEDDDEQIQYDQIPLQNKQDPEEDVEEMEDTGDFDFDSLFAELDADLHEKLKSIQQFQKELDEYGDERNFYFDKLVEIEKACSQYSKKDAEPVMKVLQLSSTDFAPANNDE